MTDEELQELQEIRRALNRMSKSVGDLVTLMREITFVVDVGYTGEKTKERALRISDIGN